jgi:hypothetical protein
MILDSDPEPRKLKLETRKPKPEKRIPQNRCHDYDERFDGDDEVVCILVKKRNAERIEEPEYTHIT